MDKIRNKFYMNDRGFTLVDVAIALTVIGILLVPLLTEWEQAKIQEKTHEDYTDIISIRESLSKYALKNGFLPAPADPTLDISSANYGVPVTTLPDFSAGECTNASAAINGIVCRPGERDTDIDGDSNAATHAGEQVFIGALPVSALGMAPEDGINRHGQKYTYLVTSALTNPATYDDEYGAIRILSNENMGNAIGTGANIQFAVISHGMNGAGGYTASGNRVACPDANTNDASFDAGTSSIVDSDGNPVSIEAFNCNDDAELLMLTQTDAFGNVKMEHKGNYLNEGSSEYFDDYVAYEISVFSKKWTPRGDDLSVMTSGSESSRLSINNNDTYTPARQVDINGSLRADRVETERLCNDHQSRCFLVDDLVSTDTSSAKFLKCNTRGLKNIELLAGKAGRWSEALGNCEVITRVEPTADLGTEDGLGIICANGSRGINGEGKLICK